MKEGDVVGLFKKIKKIIDNRRLLYVVNRKFNPYLKSRANEFGSLVIVSDIIDLDITRIYFSIKPLTKKKFIKSVDAYEQLLVAIKDHNAKVSKIDASVSSFDYDAVLSNPESFKQSDFADYLKTSVVIKEFKERDARYDEFCTKTKDVSDNLSHIKRQHELYPEYERLFSIDGDYYFDADMKDALIEHLKPIIESISSVGKEYYDFSKLRQIDEIIAFHNNNYINRNLSNPVFDSVNGRSMDKEQRLSVLKDEKSALTIAGAGSGKTLTICGKVKYILEHDKVNPDDILLLSYSKKSADDLASKVKAINERLNVGTFHKLGLDILKEAGNKIFLVEEQYNAIIEGYFRDEMRKSPLVMKEILTYFAFFLSPNEHEKRYEDDGKLFEDLKKSDFRTLKSSLLELSNKRENKETLKKELVKSFEEMALANYYFINGIDYVYETPYFRDVSTSEKRQYTPDFFLPKYNIYHEHYGIDRNGKANQYKGEEANEYLRSIAWKRATHSSYQTTCIESFSYEFQEGTVFDNLKKRLSDLGVEFQPLTPDQITNALDSIYEGQNFKSFINLVRTFINLYKARYTDSSQFEELKHCAYGSAYEKERASLFLDICKRVYIYYIDHIRGEGKIDFDDMILKSMDALDEVNSYKYGHIIVDEFQDISYSRMLFLKKLIEKGNSRLYVVGDDWQAIYRFSGCDLDIFLNFKNYFGRSQINYITSTHRNSQELQDIAGPFIKANPEQFDKTIRSDRHLENPIKLMYYSDEKQTAFMRILADINQKDKNAKVLILGRNNRDIDALLSVRFYIDRNQENEAGVTAVSLDYRNLKLTYSTVHSSKGLEEDYVIIINAEDARLGFPNKMEDDVLLNLVLSSSSNYEFAEERRLWYVALTRTRTYTYILVSKGKQSVFVDEIAEHCDIMNPEAIEDEGEHFDCPHCKSGRLVLRVGSDGKQFYGCSNYPYCTYTINDFSAVKRNLRCRYCGDYMVYKKGQWGSFYGCHSFPRCNYTEKYEHIKK